MSMTEKLVRFEENSIYLWCISSSLLVMLFLILDDLFIDMSLTNFKIGIFVIVGIDGLIFFCKI